ncbi:DUF3958 family protein [Listeria aquatica]|uniref:DUF3958 family protein n=1 Tax=Listeria aquatica TaxID=1494960 RepID=A0A841ZLT7_9LIST|nr:DUF3958 family protein [Listeria aquatica]MBC1520145.1 DUF3958 family protein [Listeria aquatica]
MNSKQNRQEDLQRIRYQLQTAEEDFEKHGKGMENLKEAQENYGQLLNRSKQLLDELGSCWQGDFAQQFQIQSQDKLFQEERKVNERFYDRYDEMHKEKREIERHIQEVENNYRKTAREDT